MRRTYAMRLPNRLRFTWSLVRDSVLRWSEDGAPSMGAALAFYCAFSLAPMLLIAVSVAGLVLSEAAVQAAVQRELRDVLGAQSAVALGGLIDALRLTSGGWMASLIGLVTLLIGATSVFSELQSALNKIWRAPAAPRSGLSSFVRTRLLSFGLVLAIGFLLLVTLVISAALTLFLDQITRLLPEIEFIVQFTTFGVSFAVVTALFAMIYKWLPDVRIAWRDVWLGAAVTALLFNIGRLLIGLYLGQAAVASAYGAAGAFVVLLLWLYYSAQIFLLGAEFTAVYSERRRLPCSRPQSTRRARCAT